MRGKFVAICGPDGAGKSTHVIELAAEFNAPGRRTWAMREPTARLPDQAASTDWRISSAAYALDRAEHSRSVILPALERGEHVLCDRYLLSNIANTVAQAIDPRSPNMSEVPALVHLAHVENPAVIPDAVIVLDAPDAVLDARIAARQREGKASAADVAAWRDGMRRVFRHARHYWTEIAFRQDSNETRYQMERTRFYTVDTSGPAAETHARLKEIVGEVLNG